MEDRLLLNKSVVHCSWSVLKEQAENSGQILRLVYTPATDICVGLSWTPIMGMTLNELTQLKNLGFGQPPRHGLNLLYWFANECVDIDRYGHMVPKVKIQQKAYGFHPFHNRIDDDDDGAPLPNQNLPKYEVGNLSAYGANQLPSYVRGNYTGRHDDSNKDRIIVCLKDGYLDKVYVAEHTSPTTFNRSHTYRVSQGLIKIIKSLTREEFLQKTQKPILQNSIYFHRENQANRIPENNSWCTIL